MKHDIKYASITKYMALFAIFYIFYVAIEYDKDLVNDLLIQLTLVTGIYLSAKAYITKVIRAGIIQGIDIMQEISGTPETEEDEQ